MITRRGFPLRWRIAALTTLAIAFLAVIASIAAYVAVRASLRGDLQRALRQDVLKVAEVYSGKVTDQNVEPLSAPTGRVLIQLYDPQGQLFAASAPEFELPEAAIDESAIMAVEEGPKDWRGELLDQAAFGALARIDLGVVAVIATTGFIDTALQQLAQTLFFTVIALVILSGVVGYFIALTAMRPLTHLAYLAEQLGPEDLRAIPHEGPDDELGLLSEVLNNLIARLKAAIDAQKIFLAETSHELRTPLTSLQGFLTRASRKAHPEVQRDLADAKRISQTMSRLVADLLQLSRGELVQEIVPHLLDPYLDILKPIAEEYPGVSLEGSAGKTLVGDPERLRQLIRNLTANAIRATKTREAVSLVLKKADNAVILEVQDEGPGIPQEMLPKIFDKFYKGPGGGAGLGLAIVKQVADVHKAKLEVESTLGEGTCFRVILEPIEDHSDEAL